MRLRVIHKGLILVAVPLALQFLFVGALVFLLMRSDAEQEEEARRCEAATIGARILFANCGAGATLVAALRNRELELLEGFYKECDYIDKLNKEMTELPDDLFEARQLQIKCLKAQAIVTARFRRIAQVAQESFGPQMIREISINHRKLVKELNITCDLWRRRTKIVESCLPDKWKALEELQNAQNAVIICGLLASLASALGLASFYRSEFLSRIAQTEKNVNSLSLDQAITSPLEGNDEIAALDASFRNMSMQLQAAAERERAIFQNSADGIFVLDESLEFMRSNKACEKLFAVSSQDLAGKSVFTVLPAGAQDEVAEKLLAARGSGASEQFEAVLLGGGKETTVFWTAFWSPDLKTCHCVVHDVTEERELDRMRESFLKLIAQDFNEPLKEVSAYVERLADGSCGELPEQATRKLVSATGTLNRMLSLVDELIQLETLKSISLNLKLKHCRLLPLLQAAAKDTEALAERQKVRVEINCSEDLHLAVDQDRFVRVLMNLLSNAIKFSPAESCVELNAALNKESLLEVQVKDQGRGIRKEMLPEMFQPFKQVSKEDSRRGKGTGLGLVVCKRIIEEHGGRILVESEEGKGSCFSILLPAADASSRASGSTGSGSLSSAVSGGGLTALTEQAGSKQAGSKQAGSEQARTEQAGSKQAGSKQAGSKQADTEQADTEQAQTYKAMPSLFVTGQSCTDPKGSASSALSTTGTSPTAASPAVSDKPPPAILKAKSQEKRATNFFENLSFKKKGLLLIGLPFVFQLIFMLAMAAFLKESQQAWAIQLHDRQATRCALWNADPIFRLLVGVRDPEKHAMLYSTCIEIRNEIPAKLKELHDVVKDDKLLLHHYRRLLLYLRNTLFPLVREMQLNLQNNSGTITPDDSTRYGNSLVFVLNGLSSHILELVDSAENRDKNLPLRIKQMRKQQLTLLAAALVLNIGLAAWLAVYFSQDVVRRLLVLSDNSQRLAAGLPLNQELSGKDEIAQLDRSFHEMSQRLAQARATESTFLDNAKNIICSLKSSGEFESLNRLSAAKFGIDRAELTKTRLSDLIISEQKELLGTFLEKSKEQNKPSLIELKMLDAEGQELDMLWSFVWSETESIYFAVAYDVTSKRELERMKKEFLALLTHDLRTPLTTIQGMAILLETGSLGKLPEPALALTGNIRARCKQILDLVNDLLDLSKLEAGELKCELQDYSLLNLLEKLSSELKASNLAISFCSEELPPCRLKLDSDRVISALSSLLQIAFVPKEKTVETAEALETNLSQSDDFLTLSFQAKAAGPHIDAILQELKGEPGELPANSSFRVRLPLARRILLMQNARLEGASPAEGLLSIAVSFSK